MTAKDVEETLRKTVVRGKYERWFYQERVKTTSQAAWK
jgi:hypothetical protein